MREQALLWAGAAGVLLLLVLLRRPMAALVRLVLRTGLGLLGLWAFNGVGSLIGVRLGFNLFNGLVLGLLGAPGLGLLLLWGWVLG